MADVTVQPTEQMRYRRYRPSVRAARADARALAGRWQHPQLADDLALTVSELVTNAVIHGATGRGSHVQVTYALLEDRLRVEVRDAADGRPLLFQNRAARAELHTLGRGLTVVAALSHRWGVIPRVIGKSVWAELLLLPLESSRAT
ncbi:ATP-binding protein [Streptomyces albidoflavus]|uniref:ATP-binding protein n=1 Tax=Streptomyces albidoflavus TaxID=1886 RepID=UPI0033F27039